MRLMVSLESPAELSYIRSMLYLLMGFWCSGLRITPGMSRCSASCNVSLIHVSSTLGVIWTCLSLLWNRVPFGRTFVIAAAVGS